MQKRRILKITYTLAAFAVVLGFALQNYVQARHYERLLSNSYVHAFSELTTAAGELDSALQKARYTTPGPLRQSLLEQVYAKALAAQSALGELPYGSQDLEHTAAFFAQTGDYAAALCRGGTEDSGENLTSLADISQDLNRSLIGLQGELDLGGLDLMAVERATRTLSGMVEPAGQELGGTTFQDVEAEFPEMPSLIYDGPFSSHLTSQTPAALDGLPQVTLEEAKKAAAAFLHAEPAALTLVSLGEGVLPTYSFSLPQDGGPGYIEVTHQGGQVLDYFQDRQVGAATMDAEEGVTLAQNYLANWGFGSMRPTYHIQREGRLTVHFAAVQDGVLCYPDLVKVSIALDTGKLLGYEAHGYLSRHRVRQLESPAVSQEEAQAAVPDTLTVLAAQTALIPTAGGSDEVLTYEFKCETEEGTHVLIYVNAQTGQQQNILLLLEDESGTLTL